MASAAFVTEYRSFISFECESSSTQYLNSKNLNNTDHRMPPLQEIERNLGEKKLVESPPMLRNGESPPMVRNGESPLIVRNGETPLMVRNGGTSLMKRNGGTLPILRNREYPMSSPGISVESLASTQSQPIEEALNSSSMMVYQPPSDESNGTENGLDHIKRMEDVLEKNGIFVQNSSNDGDCDDELEPHTAYDLSGSSPTIPKCHCCGFSAATIDEYNEHKNSHYPYKCCYPDCFYTARTKGRLENHMKNHREVSDYWPDLIEENGHGMVGNGDLSPLEEDDEPKGNKKNRVTKCRHCDFVGQCKSDLYAHLRERLCFTGPLLECGFRKKNGKLCDFCTHYKHHLEYHLRNHYESKPYKCRQCKYTCVNQSMLNSHMKSHSNSYPYRCKTCTYATKYLHSLKMHLQKYDHEPDKVLNKDGTINTDIIIDVNGRRRGPKPKKAKTSNSAINQGASTSTVSPPLPSPSHPATSYNSNPSVSPLNPPFVYNSNLFNSPMFNSISHSGFYPSPFFDPTLGFRYSPPMDMDTHLRCHFPNCEFVADSSPTLQQHISAHLLNFQRPIGINSARFQFGQDTQGSGVFHFGSDNSVLGSHFQNGSENIPRTQASSHPQFSSREHTAVRAPGAFKLSAKVLNEMEIRGRISPTINNGTLYHDFGPINESRNPARNYLHAKQSIHDLKKLSLDDNLNRLSNNSRSSSLSPPSTEQAGASCCSSGSNSSGTCYDAGWDNTAPMDLTKNLSSTCNGMDTGSETKPKNVNLVSISPQRPVKHRRKGKAFKIDQYMQYEEHSPEYTNPLIDMENQCEKYQSNESNIKMEVEDLSLSLPRINGENQVPNRKCHSKKSKTSEKNSTPKRIKSSPPAPFQASPKKCSTLKVPTAAAKNGHPFGKNDGQLLQEVSPSGFHSEDSKPGERNCGTLSVSLNHSLNSSSNSVAHCSSASPKLMDKKEPKTKKKEPTKDQEANDQQTCFHCQIGFSDFVMLCMHMACHTVGNPFKCQKCNEECENKVGFMYHIINKCRRS